MPCGKTNIPAPKLLISLPLGSNSSTAGRSELRQLPPHRSKAQMLRPSRSGVTAITPPHWRPSGNWPNLTPAAWGLGKSIDGTAAFSAAARADEIRHIAPQLPVSIDAKLL